MPALLTPAELIHQEIPGQIALAGRTVVYTLRRVVDGVDRTELWTAAVQGGQASPLVSVAGHAFSPRIDRSGEMVAFLLAGYDAPAQVHLCDLPRRGAVPESVPAGNPPHGSGTNPVAPSEIRRLTDFPRGAYDLAWYPYGSALVVLAEDEASGRVVRAPGTDPAAAPTAIRLTTADWRADGEVDGGLRLYPRHLHRVPLDGSESVRLTAGPWSASRPRVDNAGAVYYLADPGPDADLWPVRRLHRLDAAEMPATVTGAQTDIVRYHLSGTEIRVLAHLDNPRVDHRPPVWCSVAAGGALSPLGSSNPGCWVGLLGDETDLHDWMLELDDCPEVTTASEGGSTLPIEMATGAPLLGSSEGRGCVAGAVAAEGDAVVAVLAGGRDPREQEGSVGSPVGPSPDLYALVGDAARRITHHGDWLRRYAEPPTTTVEIDGPAGPITTYITDPPVGIDCKATVIDLHGGPTGQWAAVPPVEALLLAGAGYRVVRPNIRGSIDRGAGWVEALAGRWGEVDVADVLAVASGLLERGLAAESALGVIGLSYGGFLTQYVISQTDLFAAAVAENGVTNQISAWAGSDLGPSYNRAAGLSDPLTTAGAQSLWQRSPLARVAEIRTPLLMLQGGDDRTCPASDNEQLFVALRALGRTVEYVLYPEESHLMQATARFDRRVDRHQRVIAWFDTYLQ